MCINQEPADAQMSFSSSAHPTAGITISLLEFMQTRWEALLTQEEFAPVHEGICAGLTNLNKWYRKLDDTDFYFICLGTFYLSDVGLWLTTTCSAVLDPRMKLEYTKHHWEKKYHEAGVKVLETLVIQYCLTMLLFF